MAEIIDGKTIAKNLKDYLKESIVNDSFLNKTTRMPSLWIVRVEYDPASAIYCRQKEKACKEIGIDCNICTLPYGTDYLFVMNKLRRLSLDNSVDGIILQLPLPPYLEPHRQEIIRCIDIYKDVDCLTDTNYGRLFTGPVEDVAYQPCTPRGIKMLLDICDTPLESSNVVIIGRSRLVGAPLARILESANANVTVCHSKTPKEQLDIYCKNADFIISAVGNGKTIIIADMLTPGRTTIIDVAINRNKEGKIYGDVDFDNCKEVAKAITPVPGGVGPMTVTMLLFNTYYSWRYRLEVNNLIDYVRPR